MLAKNNSSSHENGNNISENTSMRVQRCLDRLIAGDPDARDELINVAYHRLLEMMKNLSYGYRNVKRLDDTEGILADASMRLHESLSRITPRTPREFFGLAAKQMRWELLDLARKLKSGLIVSPGGSDFQREGAEISDYEGDPQKFLAWTDMHEKIDELPDEIREVFMMKYYFDMSNEEIAEIIGKSAKTVNHRWRDAKLNLYQLLKGHWPDM